MSNRIDIGYGMSMTFTKKANETVPSDVWLNFHADDGKSSCISIAAEADRTGHVIGGGLRSWASDRINEYMAAKIAEEDAKRERDDSGQFGAGA